MCISGDIKKLETAGGLNYCGALGRRHRLELSMLSPELLPELPLLYRRYEIK